MDFKFLLIYSYMIFNCAASVLPSTGARPNYGLNVGAKYRAPSFKYTASFSPTQKTLGIINPGINKPINSFSGHIGFNTVSHIPTNRNTELYAKQPPYNPNYKEPPTPAIRSTGLYAKQPPYNPNYKVPPTPAIRNPGSNQRQPPHTPHSSAVSEPTTKNQRTNQTQPQYKPHFTPAPGSIIQNDNANQKQSPLNRLPSSTNQNHLSNPRQAPYNPHFDTRPKPIIQSQVYNPIPPLYSFSAPGSVIHNNDVSQRQPAFNMPPSFTYQNHWSNHRQPPYNPHFKAQPKPIIQSQVHNPTPPPYSFTNTEHQSKNGHGKNVVSKSYGILGAIRKFLKNLTKKHHSTKAKETFENPILLSPEDSEDNFPIMDLINSYSPKDSNSNLRKSLAKGVVSNKLPALHRYNLETKPVYLKKPFILVAIVVSSAAAMVALTGGIMFYFRKKN